MQTFILVYTGMLYEVNHKAFFSTFQISYLIKNKSPWKFEAKYNIYCFV